VKFYIARYKDTNPFLRDDRDIPSVASLVATLPERPKDQAYNDYIMLSDTE
jgi:hypothetical protein